MLSNLFSIFDPGTSLLYMQFGWLSLGLGLPLLGSYYWLKTHRAGVIWILLISNLTSEMRVLMEPKKSGSILFPLGLFFFILASNTMGLMGHVFTCTSHLSISLSLSLPIWLGLVIWSLYKSVETFLAHLVPLGTPPALMAFMVIIETISLLMRPMTLAVRLSANMIAGHLILSLSAEAVDVFSMIQQNIMLNIVQSLLSLEAAVAIIQAYVFATLVSLYISEV